MKPNTPHADAGILIDPPISVPVAIGQEPVAKATPEPPEADARSLVLYDVSVIPYSLKKTGVNVKSVDNAHFTQSDIGRLNERVEDLEKDTQLDNVENAILSAEVNDSTNTNLFKTGVLVDSFRNLDVAYPQSDDFAAALDQNCLLYTSDAADE